jgi:3',5'-nucleoside bisphosphate phosphatase
MSQMFIDLHVHTEESDGSLPVSDVIRIAAEQKIRMLSLTDHETTKGVSVAVELGTSKGINIIPGVELVTAFRGREVHLLGYFNAEKIDNPCLQSRLQELRIQRTALAYDMVKCLQKGGYSLKWAEVEQVAKPEGAVSKGHIMRALYHHENGNIHWTSIAKLFQPCGIAYIPFLEHAFEDAVDFIFYCGGVPVLAHPGLLKDPKLVQHLLNYRPIGLEVYYGYWEKREILIKEFETLANEKALFSTGGSDFHGQYGLVNMGEIDVPSQCATDLMRYLNIIF